jgi:hypothetical protein
MDNQMRFGSGSPLLGGTSALQEAAARRGVDVSALSQVGGAAPTAQPIPMAPQGPSMPPTGDMSMGAPAPLPVGAPEMPGQPLPAGPTDSEIILKALTARLQSTDAS